MALTSEIKAQILAQYQRAPSDTGSPEAQIALLTHDIKQLTPHFHTHHHDHHSRRGLLAKVSRRRKLLRYLKHSKRAIYYQLISQLGLRDQVS